MKSASKSAAKMQVSPAGKKLIQARLPFKTVINTPPANQPSSSASGSNRSSSKAAPAAAIVTVLDSTTDDEQPRKRKLSATSPSPLKGVRRLVKINRTEQSTSVLAISSDDDDTELSNDSSTAVGPPTAQVNAPTPDGRRKSVGKKTPTHSTKTTPNRRSTSRPQKRKASPLPDVVADASADDDDCVLLDDAEVSAGAATTPNFAIKLPLSKRRMVTKTTPKASPTTTPLRLSPRKSREAKVPNGANGVDNTKVKTPAKTPAKTFVKIPAKTPVPATKSTTKSPAKSTPAKTSTTSVKSPAKTFPATKTPTKSPAQPTSANTASTRSRRSLTDKVIEAPKSDDAIVDASDATPEVELAIDTCESASNVEDDDKRKDITSSEMTPQRTRATNSAAAATAGSSSTPAGRTPKRKLDAEVRQRDKDRQREERERKLADEKEQRQRDRNEKERQRKQERDDKEEQKRVKREELEEQKRVEREKKRQDELDERRRKEEQRDEERRRKEEQKEEERRRKEEQKEEERRRKEEERRKKEEAEKKKIEKSSAAFTRFFKARRDTVPVGAADGASAGECMEASNDADERQNFMPFRVKEDMKLAPLVRRVFSTRHHEELDEHLLRSVPGNVGRTYLVEMKSNAAGYGRSGRTWQTVDADVQIVDDELEGAAAVIEEPTAKQTYRAKFFKFEENRRPPYYGTWRRKSTVVTARKPFANDTVHFDYECDSDDEWEEEEPGESLHGSDDEKDRESDDEYDIDNQFFVPHGHLSDEEMDVAENGDDDDDDDDDDDNNDSNEAGRPLEDNTPAAQKAKLKIAQLQFANEMKKKTEKIKPRLVGIVRQRQDGGKPDTCPAVIWDMLCARAMIGYGNGPVRLQRPAAVAVEAPDGAVADAADGTGGAGGAGGQRVRQLADEDVPDLVRLLHGNCIGKKFLLKEFHAHLVRKHAHNAAYTMATLRAVQLKLNELAQYGACPATEGGDMAGRFCWYVPAETRQKYGLADLGLPNAWEYTLQLRRERRAASTSTPGKEDRSGTPPPAAAVSTAAAAAAAVATPSDTKVSKFNIAQFTKVLSTDEKRKQFEASDSTAAATATNTTVVKKRVSLKPAPASSPAAAASPASSSAAPVVRKRVSILASVPLNQEIPAATRNALISSFLGKSTTAAAKSTGAAPAAAAAASSETGAAAGAAIVID